MLDLVTYALIPGLERKPEPETPVGLEDAAALALDWLVSGLPEGTRVQFCQWHVDVKKAKLETVFATVLTSVTRILLNLVYRAAHF